MGDDDGLRAATLVDQLVEIMGVVEAGEHYEQCCDAESSAYAPGLPGCVATGATLEECARKMRDAIAFTSRDSVRAPSPEPSRVTATYVDIAL